MPRRAAAIICFMHADPDARPLSAEKRLRPAVNAGGGPAVNVTLRFRIAVDGAVRAHGRPDDLSVLPTPIRRLGDAQSKGLAAVPP